MTVIASGLVFLLVQAVLLSMLVRLRGARAAALVVGLLGAATAAVFGLAIQDRWNPLGALRDELAGDALVTAVAPPADNDPALLDTLAGLEPMFPRPATDDPADWQRWQEQLRGFLARGLFELDRRSANPTSVATIGTRTLDNGLQELRLSVGTSDGALIPMILYLPAASEPLPAIAVLPGHPDGGKEPSPLAQMTIRDDSYQHAAARRLAEAGFVTITFELRGFGELGQPQFPEHRLVAYNAILAGTFYKAVVLRDVARAVAILRQRPEVDASRIGLTGASLGGELSVTYGALDPGIKAVLFQSYSAKTGPFIGMTGDASKQPHYCHIIPGSGRLFRQEDMFLLLAPRPTLGIRGDQDAFGDPDLPRYMEQTWSILGAPDKVALRLEPGGHQFYVEPAVAFFRAEL